MSLPVNESFSTLALLTALAATSERCTAAGAMSSDLTLFTPSRARAVPESATKRAKQLIARAGEGRRPAKNLISPPSVWGPHTEPGASEHKAGRSSLQTGPCSAADRAHRPRRLAEARLADVVLQFLAPDGVADDRLDLGVARATSQRLAQVSLMHREETGSKLALGGEADAVAIS